MSVRLNHIRSLKIRCNKLIGRSISNHSDVLLLKSILDENLDENISLSSLRRFFGLISPTKPNKKTLDILSKGIGFLNFYEFCDREEKNIEWNSVRSIILIQQKEILTQEDINSLTNLKNENILLFSYFIFEIIIKEKFNLLTSIFNNPEILPEENYKIGKVSDFMTHAMRKLSIKSINELIPYLNSNYLLRNYLIYYSVDYNSFYGWYLKIIKSDKINKNFNDSLFHELIINTSLFLSGSKINELRKVSNYMIQKIHPILLGRYIGLKSINSINDNLIFSNVPKGSEMLFFYEIMTILIITKKFKTISKIENLYYEELLSRNGNTFEDKVSIYLIAFCVNNLKNNNFKLANLNLGLINFELVVSSYYDYIKLLSSIPLYHIAIMDNNNERAFKILQEYCKLKNKLNFKYFSVKFLKTYFD
ncbi:hypothetical protein N9K49_05750 [Flavobacteriaceae bacterium]|nr:hypothetical protein [Flavobacteriaceae bacterium]